MKASGTETNYRIVQSLYDGSWRKMWVWRPRIRNDGNPLTFHHEHVTINILIDWGCL
ncbi:hypothetical protein GW17_00041097 [Ensete ventricosum]|uniref:Uncharacterized protein n=1 Tax=Ensete ventricosum TaxID=4639 RepID=A0A427AYP7_ENSVE|nr:hypothetical protein B296_00009836 [Ensete ventricosum]RWV96215.1 hypothetical protein GW17_00041097 [Ensete ventricosum]